MKQCHLLCLKCRKNTESKNRKLVKTKKGQKCFKKYVPCMIVKNRATSNTKELVVFQSLWENLLLGLFLLWVMPCLLNPFPSFWKACYSIMWQIITVLFVRIFNFLWFKDWFKELNTKKVWTISWINCY